MMNENVINLDEAIEKTSKLLENLKLLNEIDLPIVFVTVEDLVKATNLSRKTVLNIYNDPEFPCCDYGKTKIAELSAVIEYFSVPRRKELSIYWKRINDAA